MELKYKTKKCKICRKPGFKNPRSLSMHMHIAHKYLDELETQEIIARTFIGEIKLSQFLHQLDAMTTEEREEDETIPPVVKKYWKLLRAAKNKEEKEKEKINKSETGLEDPEDSSGKVSKQTLQPLTAGPVKSKLRDCDPDSVLGVFVKDLDTYHFIADAKYDSKTKAISLQTTKKADAKTRKMKSKSGKLLTAEQLLYFLENAGISGTAQFYMNNPSEGAAKLTKLSEKTYLDGVKAVLFTFEYDKAYYKQYMAKYSAARKKKKEKEN